MNKKRRERPFDEVLADLVCLDLWIKDGVGGNWSITEKLAFLRNAESVRRTEEARRRTWLSIAGFLLAATAFVIALLK